MGADQAMVEEIVEQAKCQEEILQGITDYGSQCLAQVFETFGLQGKHGCWIGLLVCIGADVRKKQSVADQLHKLAKLSKQSESAT